MGIERQHYVPQGFLKGFTSVESESDKFIWVYEKLEGRNPRRVSIKSVAWESFYYEQETEAGARDTDTLERALAVIDGKFATIVRSIKAIPGKTVDLAAFDYGELSFILALSLTRGPSFREPIRELHTRYAQNMLERLAQEDSEFARRLEEYGVTAEAKSWVSLRPMVELARVVSRSMLGKEWQFFVPPEGFSLITSDNPVIFDGPGGMVWPAHPRAEVVVNLRRDLALVCTPNGFGTRFPVFQMSKHEGRKFNRGIARAARRFVFADRLSAGVETLVKKYIGEHQTIEIL